MRIAYITGDFPRASEQFIVREVEELRRTGVDVEVYPVERSSGFVCPWCVLGGLLWLAVLPGTWRAIARFPFGELAAMRMTAWRHYVGGLLMAARFARDMRAKGIEHVHAHWMSKPADVGLMVSAMLRVPFTISAHAGDVFCGGIALDRKVAAAEFVAVCNRVALEALAAKVPAGLRERLKLVRHGVDVGRLEFDWPRREGHAKRPLLLAAGRLVEKKGFACLIEAMAELENCVCEIAGAGPLEAELRRDIERRGLNGRVRLIGWITPGQMRTKMGGADVLVVPSVLGRNGDRERWGCRVWRVMRAGSASS